MMKYKALQTRWLITVQRPGLWLMSLVAFLLLLAFLFWLSFDSGRLAAGYDSAQASEIIGILESEIKTQNDKIAESQRQNAMLERDSQFDGNASDQLNEVLRKTQAEVLELKKELSFYRSIVSPEQAKRSVTIHTIQLNEILDGEYTYKIMVAQRGRNDHIVRGTMRVEIRGLEQGIEKIIGLYEVSAKAKKVAKFGFRYFQNFEGSLKLPETFKPVSMRIKLQPNLKSVDPVDEKFDWQDLATGE